ncbi:MAG: hypothetical protein ABI655_08775, partial [Phenylobacterium sp.]
RRVSVFHGEARRPETKPMDRTVARDLIRPFAWLAAIAFTVGFWGYLIVGPGQAAARSVLPAFAAEEPAALPTTAPTSDEWNIEKHI